MIIYGTGSKNIGNFGINNHECSHCGSQESQEISVIGKYLHVFWIPFFPIGKKAFAECTHCKKTIEKGEFPQDLKSKYEERKHLVKRPFYHWAGLMLVGILILVGIVGAAVKKEDPREALLMADIDEMSLTPEVKQDSVAFLLKQGFGEFLETDMPMEDVQYLTKTKGDKLLVLVKVPELKDFEKEDREKFITLIERLLTAFPELSKKEVYIGVHGKLNMMLVKTPTAFENSNLALDTPLLEFYGESATEK